MAATPCGGACRRRKLVRGPYLTPKGKGDPYIPIPAEFWTHGWIAAMSGPGIWALLALLSLADFAGKPVRPSAFISGSVRESRLPVSASTWTRGSRELVETGLAERTPQRGRDTGRRGAPRRPRFVYSIALDVMKKRGP